MNTKFDFKALYGVQTICYAALLRISAPPGLRNSATPAAELDNLDCISILAVRKEPTVPNV
jgi:hypothetical protein